MSRLSRYRKPCYVIMTKIRIFRLYDPTLQRQEPEAMIQIGKANPRCLNYKDIVKLEVVLRNVK